MTINTLRMVNDHVGDEVDELKQEIAELVEALHEKQSRLATLESLRLLASLHGGIDADGNRTEDRNPTKG